MKLSMLLSAALVVATVSCRQSGNSTGTATATDNLINNAQTATNEVLAGAQLITKSDCFTCHAVDSVVTGPAFKTIAQKYQHIEGNVNKLSNSIIDGSKGIWGPVEMTPHPYVSTADAQEMVRYIFSLDSTHTTDTTGTYGNLKSKPR
ncbi:cytochrome c [Filimonas zeae]|uniref:Cytochrome c n=1 Tax=Filimonas zeae TaxID=1737353 RepID=A0A917IZL0_9BACT|nr:c-type cytochrome [Filimonas zeae]MDR6340176.1 cytochrome c [Filimonas zeae]GGH71511.1 cytochrome c [Filimonas zeae]